MDKTIVRCDLIDCGEPASHKVAAYWSDGRFAELKTYGFACPDHVEAVCRKAEVRWLNYDPVPGEVVGGIAIYQYEEGKTDREFARDRDLEVAFLACPPPFY